MNADATQRALYGKLSGDTTLSGLLGPAVPGYTKGIYVGVAPQGAQAPYVILNKQSGVPTEAMGDPSAFENDVWLVKGVSHGQFANDAQAIATRVIALLNDANLTISGATTLYLRRRSDVQYQETTDGEVYWHVGALFKLITD